jgi:hypothetical protein
VTDQRPPTYTGEPTNQTPPDFNLGGYIDPIKPRLGAYRATFEVVGQRGREMTARVSVEGNALFVERVIAAAADAFREDQP